MTPEQLSALAQQAGATHYSPPPMRAVRGWSFTHEQLAAFADALAAQAAQAARTARRFPIMRHPDIVLPWTLIELHEEQAQRNHYQSLQRLAERGGLSCCEAAAVLENRSWQKIVWPEGSTRTDDPARDYLLRLIAQRTADIDSRNKSGV